MYVRHADGKGRGKLLPRNRAEDGARGHPEHSEHAREAEVRHYRTFERLKNQEKAPVADLVYLATVKNIFVRMREGKDPLVENGSETELYRKAQGLEEKARDFYRGKAGEVPHNQREILLKIANEEQKHYDILENIIQMAERPDNWLENAEWYRLEEY